MAIYNCQNNGTYNTYYLHKDHLGSTDVITNALGNIIDNLSYAPFGMRRNATTWLDQAGITCATTDYGYTSHVQLDTFGLIHMKGRIYDPKIGRFISPDPLAQKVSDPQTLNRYSYCGNNPLNYIDPSGYFSLKSFVKSVVSAAAGTVAFVLSGGNPVVAGMVAGAVYGAMNGGGVKGIVIGAVIGGVSGGVGGIVVSSFGANGAYAMLAAGATYSTATDGLDGLANFAVGVAGGILGSVIGYELATPQAININTSDQSIEDDPLEFNGNKMIASDAKGNTIESWAAASGRYGSSPSDQGVKDFGPIPEGNNYSVNPNNIQKWSDLPVSQKFAAIIGHGEWPGGPAVWGYSRAPIDIPGGSILTRGNFFIHGGWGFETGGCIKILNGDSNFFNYLSGQKGAIPLTVKYGR